MPNPTAQYSSTLIDKRVDCISIMAVTTVGKYLERIEEIYKDRGGIAGQRASLRTKTAITIRERMVKDLKGGAVLPPIVIGLIVSEKEYETLSKTTDNTSIDQIINEVSTEKISIIDGMQRTTALLEASADLNQPTQKLSNIRIEYWISKSLNSLIYRMLVLNTGQVPWDLRRQLETIYSSILIEVKNNVENIEIIELDASGRRSKPGQFQGNSIVEFFLIFTSRKATINVKERLADDFARMDAIEQTSNPKLLEYFYQTLRLLCELDKQFSKVNREFVEAEDVEGKIKSGKGIFTSSPACAGFVGGVSRAILGQPGFSLEASIVESKLGMAVANITRVVEKMEGLNESELFNFIDFRTLNERLSKPSGKVGEFERAYFEDAFHMMASYDNELPNLTPCWMNY